MSAHTHTYTHTHTKGIAGSNQYGTPRNRSTADYIQAYTFHHIQETNENTRTQQTVNRMTKALEVLG